MAAAPTQRVVRTQPVQLDRVHVHGRNASPTAQQQHSQDQQEEQQQVNNEDGVMEEAGEARFEDPHNKTVRRPVQTPVEVAVQLAHREASGGSIMSEALESPATLAR